MPLPQSGIELIADVSRYLSDMGSAIGISEEVDALFDTLIDTTDELSTALGDIGDVGAAIDIDADVSAIDDLEGSLTEVEGDHDVSVEVEVDDQPIIDFEQTLHSAIDTAGMLALGVTAIGAAAVAGLATVGVKAILDFDDALDTIEVKQRELTPGAEHLITDLYGEGWSTGRDAIAELVVHADRLRISTEDMGVALENALIVAQKEGLPATQVLETMNRLVEAGLVANFTEAADIITVGFEEGANLGGDFLTVLESNAQLMNELGLNAEQATALIVTAIDEGAGSASEAFNLLLILRQRIVDGSEETRQALASIGVTELADAFASGEVGATEFFAGVSDGLLALEDPADRAEVAFALFGRAAKTTSTDLLIAMGDTEGALGDVAGAAQETAGIIQNDLGFSIERVFRLGQERAREFLSSEQVGLDEKLATLEGQLQTFFDELGQGRTVGQALEFALEMPGLEEQISRIEGVIGNVGITIVEAFASLLEFLGKGELAAQLREGLAPLAEGQLTFDLKTALDAEEVEQQIITAFDRGVSPEAIQSSFQTAIDEMIAGGDAGGAQRLAEAWSTAVSDGITRGGQAGILDFGREPFEVPVDIALDTTSPEMQARINEEVFFFIDQMQAALDAGDFDLARSLAEHLPDSESWEPVIVGAEQAALAWQNQTAQMEQDAIALANVTHEQFVQHSITSDLEAVALAAAEHMPAAIGWFNLFRTAVVVGSGQMNVALDAVAVKLANLIGSAQGLAATIVNVQNAGGGGTVNNNTTLNQTNNISNGAQANNVANSTADAIAG